MQRKVFRIEQMLSGRMARPATTADPMSRPARGEPAGATVEKLEAELALLQDTIARNKRELAALIGDDHERPITRAAGELGAAIEGMEKCTVKILKSTEAIDESARALAASQKNDYERGLTQDIQDHVVKIYEACNFQDLGGQRIGSVIATLNMIEDRVAEMLGRSKAPAIQVPAATPAAEQELINGPRLDGASGHQSQSDIDTMFA